VDKDIAKALNSTKGIPSSKLYSAYSDWIRQESPQSFHEFEMTSTMFGRRCKASGYLDHRRVPATVYFANQKLVNLWEDRARRTALASVQYEEQARVDRPLHLVTIAPGWEDEP